MSGNIGLPASDKGTWQFTLNYDWNNLETLKAGSDRLNDDSRRRETHSILVESGYSFSEKLSLDLFFSFVRQERTINQRGLAEDFTYTQGVGDAVALLKYSIYPRLTLGLGLKLPVGSSDRTRPGGLPLNADLQPGSGAWDQIIYANYTTSLKYRPSFTLLSTIIHRFTGTNSSYLSNSTYAFGDETQVIMGVADRILAGKLLLDPSLKFRFRKAARDQFDGQNFPASGGTFVFVNPGLSLPLTPKITYQINVELPLYAKVYETQLSPSIRVNTGFFFTLPRKQSFEIIQLNN